jgi:hypothetical protein
MVANPETGSQSVVLAFFAKALTVLNGVALVTHQ